ncbi:rho GTPase-activating protein 190 [Elysia marginata]|uniref:Rho GTPase-activating protein 190 n=1 Tax=Elysia marginata TaxID=1093978 RepID=A0AAV4FJM6_9GAST|nr:rho GTPase-activating protein 190 [Elysia marginata]
MGCGTLSTVAAQSWSGTGDDTVQTKQTLARRDDKKSGGTVDSTTSEQVDSSSSHNNGTGDIHNGLAAESPRQPEVCWRLTAEGNVAVSVGGSENKRNARNNKECTAGAETLVSTTGSETKFDHEQYESDVERYVNRLIVAATQQVMADARVVNGQNCPPSRSSNNNNNKPHKKGDNPSTVTSIGDAALTSSMFGVTPSDTTTSTSDMQSHSTLVDSVDAKEKRAKEAQKKIKKKEGKASGAAAGTLTLEDYPTALENPFVPQFVFKCVNFIELEGLKTEGLYRIPGNKSQGELFVKKFSEDPMMEVEGLDIPVNAVATLLKSFFSDLPDALITTALCGELMEAAEMTDKSSRLIMLRGVIKKLPNQNLEVLKYLITHLHTVAQHQEFNNMGSRNLAKCWWPTLIPLQFKTYEKMIQCSQVPEDIVHTLIEQCPFFFHGGNEV